MRQRLKRRSLCPDVRDHRQSDYVYVTRMSVNGRGAHTADLRLAGAHSQGHLGVTGSQLRTDRIPVLTQHYDWCGRQALGGDAHPSGVRPLQNCILGNQAAAPRVITARGKWHYGPGDPRLHAFRQASCSWKEAPGAGHWVFRSVTGQG